MLDRFFSYFGSHTGFRVTLAIICSLGVSTAATVAVVQHVNTTPINPVTVTITEKTTRMDTAGYAVGTLNGETILVRGNWAPGDTATVYPTPVQGGSNPQHSTDNPNPNLAGTLTLATLMGLAIALLLTTALTGVHYYYEKHRTRREQISRDIVNAAISRTGSWWTDAVHACRTHQT